MFNGARIFEAEVLRSNPVTHTAKVRIASSEELEPFDCCLMLTHGDGTGKYHGISMPKVGAMVLVLVDSRDNAVILGALPKSSIGTTSSALNNALDPLGDRLKETNFRGEDDSDILPGDLSFKSHMSRLHLSDNELTLSSGRANLEFSDIGQHAHMHTAADSVTHKNSLFSYRVSNAGGDASPEMELYAFTQKLGQSSLSHFNKPSEESDLSIKINPTTPLEISYKDELAAVSIDSLGNLKLQGRSVTIESDGIVHSWGADPDINVVTNKPISYYSDSSITLDSVGATSISGGATTLEGTSTLQLKSSGTLGIVAGGSKKGLAVPGLSDSMTMRAPQGGITIESGSSIPGPSSLTKPGIRIESAGGGDLHLNSKMSLGGAFTSGAIVMSSATPASASLAGGAGNYGIVLNSPMTHLGGIPGVDDTPAGLPGPFIPPVPPVYDSGVNHFSFMTIYMPILMASISAGLTAAFPITAGASVSAFTGGVASAVAAMGIPPIGRSLTTNTLG